MYESNNLRVWGSDIEYDTILQAERSARLPILAGPLALMADAHIGVGATIGSVLITHGAIVPSAVGVDVGCGMIAAETSLMASDLPDDLQPLVTQFSRSIPSGVGRSRNMKSKGASDQRLIRLAESWMKSHPHPLDGLEETALSQLGTLGSGNHFIEVTLDERDVVWVILHSGSRGVGNRLADKHIKIAKAQEQSLEDRDLAYFLETQPEFHAYIRDMLWSQAYALENRSIMMQAALTDLFTLVGRGVVLHSIQCHHNFATKEVHNNVEVWVTRKGAIRAEKGDLGLIPGCLAAGTRILMASGFYQNIEDISVGDVVISGSGSPTIVTNTFQNGKKLCWTYKSNNFHSKTTITPNHLHWIGDMSTSHRGPNSKREGRAKILDRKTMRGDDKYKWRSLEMLPSSYTFLLPKVINFSEMPITFPPATCNTTKLEAPQLLPTYDLGYIFGTFLADGSARYKISDGGQTTWNFGKNEQSVAQKLIESISSYFNIHAKKYELRNMIRVVVHDVKLARVFSGFGKRTNKSLPNYFWCKNTDYLRGFYDGLIDGDGHINNGTKKFTNTSSVLIEQFGIVHYILFGYFPSVGRREPSPGGFTLNSTRYKYNPSFRSTSIKNLKAITTEQYQLVPVYRKGGIIDKSGVEVNVFDIEVDNQDHSFIANNVIVHNSMGTKSYVVRGLGNPLSYNSSSHGAGRRMSRGRAKRELSLESLEKAMEGKAWTGDAKALLDEHPEAYKNVDDVMRDQNDLVEVLHTLRQVVNYKGV